MAIVHAVGWLERFSLQFLLVIDISGPGAWDDVSEGDDYPHDQMANVVKDLVKDRLIADQQEEIKHLRKKNSDLRKV